MADISKIQLPNGTTYNIKDSNASTASNWLNGSASGSVRTINSAAEDSNYTMGPDSFAANYNTKASGNNSSAMGLETQATGACATAIGRQGVASGDYSFVGGSVHTSLGNLEATANVAFAYGLSAKATGQNSFSLGQGTTASDTLAVATGDRTVASGQRAFTGGDFTIANHRAQVAFGQYNVADTSSAANSERGNYVEIVGNGTADNARSNARTLDWSGNEVLAGKLTLGANPTANMDAVTKQYMESKGYLTLATLPIYDGTVT